MITSKTAAPPNFTHAIVSTVEKVLSIRIPAVDINTPMNFSYTRLGRSLQCPIGLKKTKNHNCRALQDEDSKYLAQYYRVKAHMYKTYSAYHVEFIDILTNSNHCGTVTMVL